MENVFEPFKNSDEYSILSKMFKNIIYNEKIGVAQPNTVYIYANVKLPEYEIMTKKMLFDYDTKFPFNNPNIFQGTMMFYSKNQYLGCYNDINNILYLIDLITPFIENNDYNILKQIIDQIQEIKEEKIRSIKQEISIESKSKVMFGDTIYDLTTINKELSFLDKLLHRTPSRCIRINNEIYHIDISNEQDIGLDSYKRILAEKAQKIIASYRQKYYDDTENFKDMHMRIIESHVPMPQFSPEEIAGSGLMMTAQRGNIIYMFKVDIKVHSVIDEGNQKYVKLSRPLLFQDGLLIIKTTQIGEIIGVKFKHEHKHFHTHPDDDEVCLGSAATKISNTRINSFDDILKLKSSIINMMSVCNTSSMFSRAWKRDEMLELINNARHGSLGKFVINSDHY